MHYICTGETIATRLTTEYGLLYPFVGAGMSFALIRRWLRP